MKCLITFLIILTSFRIAPATVETLPSAQKYELTKSHVIEFIQKLPIQHPDILYQKIMLETGHLTSKQALEYGNLVGMRTVKKRITTQSGSSSNQYGKYSDWRDSIIDYLLWQQHVVKKRLSKQQYYEFTAKIYSTNREHYVNVLKKIKVPTV